jgi:predicted methyltransferase
MIKTTIKSTTTLALCLLMTGTAYAQDLEKLWQSVAGEHRSSANMARNEYRNPFQTLAFFGVESHHTVVEVFPGGGWYTEILAPYLRDDGKLIAAMYPRGEGASDFMVNIGRQYEAFLQANPEVYDQVEMVELAPGQQSRLAEPGTVDFILDFRNAHNWLGWGAEEMVSSWHDALKTGGKVGITDHRMDPAREEGNGYIHEQTLIDVMESHGFRFVGSSEVNANPRDTKDHPGGVWNLPPTLRGLTGEERVPFLTMGESDRMTMLFEKR